MGRRHRRWGSGRARRAAAAAAVLLAGGAAGAPSAAQAAGHAAPEAKAAASPRPNIVVVLTDDQTVADMRALPKTRALVGRRGTTFADAFASYPLCCPARATLLTGQYAHNHGVLGNLPPLGGYGALRGLANTLPVWLRRAGYTTAHVGKYLNGYGRDVPADVPPGWDEWYGTIDPSTYLMWGYRMNENGTVRTYGDSRVEDPALYQTDVVRDRAVDVIRRRAPGRRPLFLSVGFLAPHSEGGRELGTEGSTIRPAPRHRGRFADARLPRGAAFDEADVTDKPPFFAKAFARLGEDGTRLAEISHRSRLASLLAVDDAVEAIVRALRRAGELDDTLIVFTSDNGFFTGEHRIPFGKYLVYEPSIRVPLLLRGPGVRAGATSRELVVNADIVATIVDAARARPGRVLDGRSLLPFARDPRRRTRRPILLETTARGPGNDDLDQDGYQPYLAAPDIPPYRAIRTRRHVYVEYASGDRELYDLARDPAQLHNRARDHRYARTRAALARALRPLATCKGRACNRQIAPIPGPAS